MTFDLKAPGFSLNNARVCCQASADAYVLTPTLVSAIDGTAVIITELAECILIAFEGTREIRQWITDAKAWRTNIKGSHIHTGFYQVIVSLLPAIVEKLKAMPMKPIVVCGHSLGGALALLGAFRIAAWGWTVHSIYTFGQPRVCDATGVHLYGNLADRTYRITNGADIVPWTPDWILAGYRHAGIEYWMPSTGSIIGHPAMLSVYLGDAWELYREWRRGNAALLKDHFMESYRQRLEACA